MVPTVEATGSLPDHGEAWRVPWEVVATGESECVMRAEGHAVPWRLERRIELGDVVRASYSLSNGGATEIPGYWCAHPLFRYEAGMEIDIGSRLMGFAEGKSGKFFMPRGEIDHAGLRWRGGQAIEIAWDREATPYCGIWICNGDLGGYRQVAIEPATGGGDRPDARAWAGHELVAGDKSRLKPTVLYTAAGLKSEITRVCIQIVLAGPAGAPSLN